MHALRRSKTLLLKIKYPELEIGPTGTLSDVLPRVGGGGGGGEVGRVFFRFRCIFLVCVCV